MSLYPRLRHAWRALFRRKVVEQELDAELQFHLAMESEANARAGADAPHAIAARAFGGVEQTKEACRDSWGTRWIDALRQDLGYAFRRLRHNPWFCVVVVLTLALGIGVNTAIFSVVEGVLLRDLPYRNPSRLMMLNQSAPQAGQPNMGFSVPDFMSFRERNRAFSALAEYHSMWFILLGRANPERVQTGVVSDNFFDLLGVKPLLGRTFLPGEDKPGAAPVLVLSYDYWQHSFGGDPNVVGRVFEMNNKPHTVVGVLPQLPAFPNPDQVYMPASACPFRGSEQVLTNRDARMLSHVFGRLKDGVTAQQAEADTKRVAAELCMAYPQNYPKGTGYTADTGSLSSAFTGNARTPLFLLLVTSGFVLLIACGNVANLTLAQLVRRDRELAVRSAIGAGRGRLMRQLFTESLLLALLGGAAGLLFAAGGLRLLVTYSAHFLPRANEIAINGPVLLFTLGMSILTALLFGLRPLLPVGDALTQALKDGSRGNSGGSATFRAILVVAQVAISVPLLIGAALATRTLFNLERVDPGIDTAHVLSANVDLNWTRYDDFPKRFSFWTRAIQEALKLPSVESVAVTGTEPLNGLANNITNFEIEHRPNTPGTAMPHTDAIAVTEDYFRTMGRTLLRGRFLLATDTHESMPVAIINESLATRYWPKENPIGQRISPDHGKTWITIVGIVSNARQQLDAAPVDEAYVPLTNTHGLISASLLIRTSAAPQTLIRDVREAIRRVDPTQPVTAIETIEQVRANDLAPRKLIASLLAMFALLALAITAAGIGGVLAFSVSQRTQEIGIRMALGATSADVVTMVLRQGLGFVVLGLIVGTIGSLFLVQLITAVLYGVSPNDPLTFVVVDLALIAVAVLACIGPARRATSISPLTALRSA